MEGDREGRVDHPAAANAALTAVEWARGEYVVSTSRVRVELDVIHRFLTTSYWAEGITYDAVRRSVEHSLPFGVYRGPGSASGRFPLANSGQRDLCRRGIAADLSDHPLGCPCRRTIPT